MKTLLKLLVPLRMLIVVVVLFIAWQTWVYLKPRPREFSVGEIRAINNACAKIADACSEKIKKPARLGVASFADDSRDIVTFDLRAELAKRKDITVVQGSPVQKFLGDVAKAVVNASSIEDVMTAAKKVEMDVIVAGKVLKVESSNDLHQAALQVYAYDVRSAGFILKETYTGVWSPGMLEKVSNRIHKLSPAWRITLWGLVVLLLPWLTSFGTRAALEKKSNLASFLLVSTYTVITMALAVTLVGFTISGGGQWLLFLLAFVVSAGYNFWACETIAGRERM
ncbi:MAG: hypothetical protein C0404_01565 [Verrucomicrobia bacterium]|nr:hypothetical protein [Verrucomicrobiota bacterium]